MNVTITLAPLERCELNQLRTWRNDYAVWRWTRQNDMLNESEHEAWFARQAADLSVRMYGVRVQMGGRTELVGVSGLTSIDYRNSRAEFSLYIAPQYQRQGYGRQALALLLAHGFANLGINLIWGETIDGNPASKIFEKLGMVKEGTRRAFYWKDNRFVDAHLYSIKRDEWIGLQRSSPTETSSSDASQLLRPA